MKNNHEILPTSNSEVTPLFESLDTTETDAIKGGFFSFKAKGSYSSNKTYNYDKSFNNYEYSGNYHVTALNEVSAGDNNNFSVFSS